MIQFNNPAHGDLIADVVGVGYNPKVDRVISRVKDGELLGGVIYYAYTGASIHAHIGACSPRFINNDFLWVIFHYPFIQLGCKVVFGQVPETNSKALEFDLKLGFKLVTRVDDVFPDGALLLLAMYREDCRWLKIKPRHLKEPIHGQEEQAAAAP